MGLKLPSVVLYLKRRVLCNSAEGNAQRAACAGGFASGLCGRVRDRSQPKSLAKVVSSPWYLVAGQGRPAEVQQ
jgi:hypothetical protein